MKIAEIAFKVKPGSQMYENFFIQEEEETKFLSSRASLSFARMAAHRE